MKLKKQGIWFWLVGVLAFLLLAGGSGCAQKKTWYKPGGGQVDFNIDDQDCRISAQEIARQATLTGEKINLKVFDQAYEACIFSRGWSLTPAAPAKSKENTPAKPRLAEIENNLVTAFGQTMMIPRIFSLVRNQQADFQGVNMQTLFFQGEDGVYLNLIFQETSARKFDPVDYPSDPPFFLFEKGEDPAKKDRLRWTVFSGDFKGTWVAGIGGYYLVDRNRRASFVVTQAISSPEGKPPAGLRLTKAQKLEVETFQGQWVGKIKTAFGACGECAN